MAPRGRPTRLNPNATPTPVTDTTTTTSVTSAQLQAMIDEGVTAVLAARATTRNGDDSHTFGNRRVSDLTQWFERMETVFRISNCTVENQVKFATCTLYEEIASNMPLQEGLPPVEEQEPGKWQRCSQGLCSGSCRANPANNVIDGMTRDISKKKQLQDVPNRQKFSGRGIEHETTSMLSYLSDYDCDIRYHPGKANVVAEAFSMKERDHRIIVTRLDITMSIGILSQENLESSTEARKPENIKNEDVWRYADGENAKYQSN
ncbi:hypothetical protein Tco_0012028 [Tanacetum coccineum]